MRDIFHTGVCDACSRALYFACFVDVRSVFASCCVAEWKTPHMFPTWFSQWTLDPGGLGQQGLCVVESASLFAGFLSPVSWFVCLSNAGGLLVLPLV